MTESEFERELQELLNKHSQENGSNTPDFILARYLNGCLRLFNATVVSRADWYGIKANQTTGLEAPGYSSAPGTFYNGL